MKNLTEIRAEIAALKRLAAAHPNDVRAQASIEGQIDVLMWVTKFKA